MRIDEALNPFSEQQLGRLHIEIGVRPELSGRVHHRPHRHLGRRLRGQRVLTRRRHDGRPARDPYGNFNFLVEIDGITRAAFHEVSGLDSTIDVIEHREGGENITHAQATRAGQVHEHQPQVGPDRRRRAVRLAPAVGRRRSGGAAQERLDRAARPAGPGEGALELLQRLADASGPARPSTPRATTSRSRRSSSPTKAWRAPDASAIGDTMFQTEYEFTLPCGYLDDEGTLHRDGVMRRATAADEILPLRDPRVQQEPGLPDRHPAVARGHAARAASTRSPRR